MDDLLQGFAKPEVLSVSDLNARVRLALETEFEKLTVEGEIGNFTRAASGHLYFTIKDEKSQVKCVMWRSRASSVRFEPEVGMQVRVHGFITVYEPRGEYQISVSSMEPAGQGALQLAFEKLKEKLQGEGLFNEERKQPLPFLPRHVGVVTSPTGAAIRDILSVLERRHPNLRVTISPCLVQGKEAAGQIVRAISRLQKVPGVDVVIVTRGGGSLEDLWPFNEEVVARAIADCPLPVISAVGHEIDFTIADFVADVRAPTPSAAAELVVSREEDLQATLESLRSRMAAALGARVRHVRTLLGQAKPQRLAAMTVRTLQQWQQDVDIRRSRLQQAMEKVLSAEQRMFSGVVASLEALSPLKALGRGYSIVTKRGYDLPIRSVQQLAIDTEIFIRLSDGAAASVVTGIEKESRDGTEAE